MTSRYCPIRLSAKPDPGMVAPIDSIFVDRLGSLVHKPDLGRVVRDGGAGGDLVGNRPHHRLHPRGEGGVDVGGVERDHIAVCIVVAMQQVLGHIGAGAGRLPIEQVADRGDGGCHRFRVARGVLWMKNHGADQTHDQFALLVIEVGAGALQRFPGQVADKGRLVAQIGVA